MRNPFLAVQWLQTASDALLAISLCSISIALFMLYLRRNAMPPAKFLLVFSGLLTFSGLAHGLGIWTAPGPIDSIRVMLEATAAVGAALTTIALWRAHPQIRSSPNTQDLIDAQSALRRESEARQLAETRFRMLFEAAPDALLIVGRMGMIELVNERCEALFGLPRDQMLGRPVEMLVPEAARESHQGHRRAYFAHAAPKPMGAGRELFARRGDGTHFPVEISLSPLETSGGLVIAASIRNISDRLEAQQKLRELNVVLSKRVDDRTAQLARRAEEMARSNKELEQFAYVVSHDLRSPMRAISSLAEWLLADQSERLDDEGRNQLELLQQRAARMHNMIEGVLEYSRAATNPVPAEAIDTRELVEEVVDGLAPPPGHDVIVDPLPMVRYPRVQLVQVFQNLIGNALKHMGGEGGKIRVSATEVGDHFEFRVADDGVGIAPQHHERVFRIFQKLSAREGEAVGGLGLAIVKKIIEHNGGKICLESHPGDGTTFILTVPRERAPAIAEGSEARDSTS